MASCKTDFLCTLSFQVTSWCWNGKSKCRIDVIHNTRLPCMCLKTNGIRAMYRSFSRAQTSLTLCFLDLRKRAFFNLRDNNSKLLVEVIIVTFLHAVATVDDLRASVNDVKPVETRSVQFAWLKSLSPCEIINKLDNDYSYWQILSRVCSLKYHVSHQS